MKNTFSGDGEVLVPEKKEKKSDMLTTMKAVRIHEYGGVDKLMYEDVDVPELGPDEVLIKVYAAGVNPVDWKIREGSFKNMQLPLIIGWDVAGVVVNVGSLVTKFQKDDKVFARLNLMGNGGYAEYATIKSTDVAHAPNIPLNMAAGVPLAAQTAWMALFEVGALRAGQKILIHGGSGGVGSFAVQLAKLAGAYVFATTSGENIGLVKSLGADEVIDYKKDDFSKMIKDIDMVFDTIGGETQARSWQVMHTGGILVSTVGADEKKATEMGMHAKSFMVNSCGSRLEQIAGLIDKGQLRVIIDSEFPLQDVKKAHERSQSGKAKGKIILKVV